MKDFFDEAASHHDSFDLNIVGLVGNIRAIEANKRFIDEDLNRLWFDAVVEEVKKAKAPIGSVERSEMRRLLQIFESLTEEFPCSQKFIIDLHTTSAKGGIFSVTNNHPQSTKLASNLGVPVISGLHAELHGTLLGYFTQHDIPGIGIETGQHFDQSAVKNALSMIWTVIDQLGGLQEDLFKHELNKHYSRLEYVAAKLPPKVEVLYRHSVIYGDDFKMASEFKNFQEIEAGELIAYDQNGPVRARESGLLLMPLYQNIGEDGFFIVRELD